MVQRGKGSNRQGTRCRERYAVGRLERQLHIPAVVLVVLDLALVMNTDEFGQRQSGIFDFVLCVMRHESTQFHQFVKLGVGSQKDYQQ